MAAIALALLVVHGVPLHFPTEALRLNQYTHYNSDKLWRRNVCFFTPDTDFSGFDASICLHEDPTHRQFLLIGDSHAADLYPGLFKVFSSLNISQVNATFCPPLVTEPVLRPEFAPNCDKLSEFIFGNYLLHHRVDTVLLSAFWDESQLVELGRTISWIQQHGMKVIVFGPSIEFTMPLPRILIASLRDHAPERIAEYETPEPRQLDITMARIARGAVERFHISQSLKHSARHRLSWKRKPMETGSRHVPSMHLRAYRCSSIPIISPRTGSVLYARAMRDRNVLSN